MKKTLAATVLMVALSTSAMAENFNNTSGKITLKSEKFSLEMSNPKTGATSFAVGSTIGEGTKVGAIDTKVTYFRNGDVDDYQIKAGKNFQKPGSPVYVGNSLKFDFGDTTTKNELSINPYIGLSTTVDKFTPYVETGYTWKSLQGNYTDMDSNASYFEIGSSYNVNETMSVKLSVTDTRDKDWDNGDKEAQVGLTVKF